MLCSVNGVALDAASPQSMSVNPQAAMRRAPAAPVMTPASNSEKQAEEQAMADYDKSAQLAKEQKELEEKMKKEDMEVFKQHDANHDGYLQANEIEGLLSNSGIPKELFDWRAFDFDKDGTMSPKEFLAGGPAVAAAYHELIKANMYRTSKDKEVFKSFDKDANGFLDKAEMDDVQRGIGLHPGDLNWQVFDADHDGKLSDHEFVASGPTVAEAIFAKKAEAEALQQQQMQQQLHSNGGPQDGKDGSSSKESSDDGSSPPKKSSDSSDDGSSPPKKSSDSSGDGSSSSKKAGDSSDDGSSSGHKASESSDDGSSSPKKASESSDDGSGSSDASQKSGTSSKTSGASEETTAAPTTTKKKDDDSGASEETTAAPTTTKKKDAESGASEETTAAPTTTKKKDADSAFEETTAAPTTTKKKDAESGAFEGTTAAPSTTVDINDPHA